MKNSAFGFKFYAFLLVYALLGVSAPYAQSAVKSNVATLPASVSSTAQNKASLHYVSEIERLSKANEDGQVIIHQGDAISRIAKQYAKINNIQFESALKGLTLANPKAFADAKHNLLVGATLFLPRKEDVLDAAKTGVFRTAPASTPVPMPTMVPEPVVTTSTAVPDVSTIETVTTLATGFSVASMVSDTYSTILDFFNGLAVWVWYLLAVLGLMMLVGLLRLLRKGPSVESDQEIVEYHKNRMPKVVLNNIPPVTKTTAAVIPEASVVTSGGGSLVVSTSTAIHTTVGTYSSINQEIGQTNVLPQQTSVLSYRPVSQVTNIPKVTMPHELIDDDRLRHIPLDTFVSDTRFNQALRGLSSESLDLTVLSRMPQVEALGEEKNISTSIPIETVDENSTVSNAVLSKGGKVYELQKNGFSKGHHVSNGFLKPHLKTPVQRWQDLGLDVNFVETTALQGEVGVAIQAPNEVLAQDKVLNPELDVNSPKSLYEYPQHLPEPSLTSVDYEDLLDHARLQAWLSVHSIDEILLYAQDAHNARYDDVAQLMLNDVLMRGNAKQCRAVLTLQYMWSYPQGVS